MTKRMIKDPYFEMYSKGGNVSKRLEGKGNLSEKKELLKFLSKHLEKNTWKNVKAMKRFLIG